MPDELPATAPAVSRNGAPHAWPAPLLPCDEGWVSLKAGDVDGDGWPDLIVQKYGLPTVLFNDGDGTFTRSETYQGSFVYNTCE